MKEKTRGKINIIIKNYEKGEFVRISNHVQFLKNTYYIIYNPPTGLQKGIKKDGISRE